MTTERMILTNRFFDAMSYAGALHGSDVRRGTQIPHAELRDGRVREERARAPTGAASDNVCRAQTRAERLLWR